MNHFFNPPISSGDPEILNPDWIEEALASKGDSPIDSAIEANDTCTMEAKSDDSTIQADDMAAPESPDSAAPLVPNLVDINAHLFALFPPKFAATYPDAGIEIAWGDPMFQGGAVNQARISCCRKIRLFRLTPRRAQPH
jgi:hypothetical protein